MGISVALNKFVGNQLRSCSYKVKITECFRVPHDIADVTYTYNKLDVSDNERDLDIDRMFLLWMKSMYVNTHSSS